MIIIVWPKSKFAIRSVGDYEEVDHLLGRKSEWYPDKYPHPAASVGELGTLQNAIDARAIQELSIRDLSPQEAYAALNGLGMPEERDCGLTAVQKVFSEQKVKKVHARQVNRDNRTIIDSIEFEDGTRMYFAASPLGSIIYRVAQPHSYLRAVDDA